MISAITLRIEVTMSKDRCQRRKPSTRSKSIENRIGPQVVKAQPKPVEDTNMPEIRVTSVFSESVSDQSKSGATNCCQRLNLGDQGCRKPNAQFSKSRMARQMTAPRSAWRLL